MIILYTLSLTHIVTCENKDSFQWRTYDKKIWFSPSSVNQTWIEYPIRGTNWFGFDTECHVVHGLWVHSMNYYIDFLETYSINTLRIPISFEFATQLETLYPTPECITHDSQFHDTLSRDILHALLAICQLKQIAVLLDVHTIDGIISETPWVNEGSSYVERAWDKLLHEYGNYPNLIGIDIKNEPHGAISWSAWSEFAQQFIQSTLIHHPSFQGLFFVEGVQDTGAPWGGSLAHATHSLLPTNRIVYSPHAYGVSVRGSTAIHDDSPIWDVWFGNWGQLNPLVIGEVGGLFIGDDRLWHSRFLTYSLMRNFTNAFYWCLNPDSRDTGGLFFYDWTTPNNEKIQFLQSLQQYPIHINYPLRTISS